ncbi:hypothetical protein [Streptosporangium roseum]|uniref:hypothetical protein n=1 Tax=Streptosporangium roseum TaxID=2001 RepID=UPI0004CD6F24|nr:hypothetical protein [Streptosporangium roseum]
MTGLELVVVVAAGGAIFAAVKHTDQRKTGRIGKGRRIPRQSKLVKIYNSTGAKPVTSPDAAGAAAELTGRAIGGAARTGSRRWKAVRTAASRGRDRLADRTAPRWERRRTTRPEPLAERLRAVQAVRRERGWRGLWPSLSRRPPEPPAPPPAPAAPHPPERPAPPGRHLRAVPSPAPKGTTVTTTSDLMAPAAIAAPADWAALIDRIASFEPEDDVALIEWMKAEAVGVVGYAESLETVRETCVTAIGLDPSAVSGITTYSEAVSETADRMSEALMQFLTVYEEVQKLVGEGVVMPYNGRWFGGATG